LGGNLLSNGEGEMVIGGQLETDRPEWANQISDRVEHFFPAYDRVELGETTAVARGGSHAPAVFVGLVFSTGLTNEQSSPTLEKASLSLLHAKQYAAQDVSDLCRWYKATSPSAQN
jgi:hypothetical protein